MELLITILAIYGIVSLVLFIYLYKVGMQKGHRLGYDSGYREGIKPLAVQDIEDRNRYAIFQEVTKSLENEVRTSLQQMADKLFRDKIFARIRRDESTSIVSEVSSYLRPEVPLIETESRSRLRKEEILRQKEEVFLRIQTNESATIYVDVREELEEASRASIRDTYRRDIPKELEREKKELLQAIVKKLDSYSPSWKPGRKGRSLEGGETAENSALASWLTEGGFPARTEVSLPMGKRADILVDNKIIIEAKRRLESDGPATSLVDELERRARLEGFLQVGLVYGIAREDLYEEVKGKLDHIGIPLVVLGTVRPFGVRKGV